jgi:hypothetical protein
MLAPLGGILARNGAGEPGGEPMGRGGMELQRTLKAREIAKAVTLCVVCNDEPAALGVGGMSLQEVVWKKDNRVQPP